MIKNLRLRLLEKQHDAANISPQNVTSFYKRFVVGITGEGS